MQFLSSLFSGIMSAMLTLLLIGFIFAFSVINSCNMLVENQDLRSELMDLEEKYESLAAANNQLMEDRLREAAEANTAIEEQKRLARNEWKRKKELEAKAKEIKAKTKEIVLLKRDSARYKQTINQQRSTLLNRSRQIDTLNVQKQWLADQNQKKENEYKGLMAKYQDLEGVNQELGRLTVQDQEQIASLEQSLFKTKTLKASTIWFYIILGIVIGFLIPKARGPLASAFEFLRNSLKSILGLIRSYFFRPI